MKKVFVPLLIAAVVVVSVFGVVLALHAHRASTPGASNVTSVSRATGAPTGAREALKRLATDPQSVAVDEAELLEGRDGYVQGIPRGSRINVKDIDWVSTGDTSGHFALTSIPPGKRSHRLGADLEMRNGLWKVTSVYELLEAEASPTS